MPANECIAYYEGAYTQKLTVHILTTAAVGRRFIGPLTTFQSGPALSATAEGGNLQAVGVPAAGGAVGGVAGWDIGVGVKGPVIRGAGTMLPVEASAAITVGDELKVAADGRVLPQGGTGTKVGKAHTAASTAGDIVTVELYSIEGA